MLETDLSRTTAIIKVSAPCPLVGESYQEQSVIALERETYSSTLRAWLSSRCDDFDIWIIDRKSDD